MPQLNGEEEQTGSECGACIGEAVMVVEAQLTLVLDGYAQRLIYSHALRLKLEQARDRLNILSPGAGDFLDEVFE